MARQRVRNVVWIAVTGALISLPAGAPPASAGCPAPSLSVEPATARPGQQIVVTGEHFAAEPVGVRVRQP